MRIKKEQTVENTNQEELIQQDNVLSSETDLLLDRAEALGVNSSDITTVEELKFRINERLQNNKNNNNVHNVQGKKIPSVNMNKRKEAMSLVRVKVTALCPNDQALKGQIFSVANSYIGTIRKFIPFGEHCGQGYHIPIALLEVLRKAKYVTFKKTKNPKGFDTHEPIYVNRYSVEVLPPLTEKQLSELKEQQRVTLQD